MPSDQSTETVWLLWEHGDLRGAYADRETAEADADVLRADGAALLGRPIAPDRIGVFPERVLGQPRWTQR